MGGAPDGTPLRGVFSDQKMIKVGFGGTAKKVAQASYYYVEEAADGRMAVQPLGENQLPAGEREYVSREDLLNRFMPEPDLYYKTVLPRMRELARHVARGDRHRTRGETFSAEFEYKNALAIDEGSIRAHFGLGLTYLDRGDAEKGRDVFQRLVSLDAAFEEDHKHLFNEFGISLRKNGLYDEAIEYYSRAIDLARSDDHIHYNIGRCCFEKGDLGRAAGFLGQALELNPDLVEARTLLMIIAKKHNASDNLRLQGA